MTNQHTILKVLAQQVAQLTDKICKNDNTEPIDADALAQVLRDMYRTVIDINRQDPEPQPVKVEKDARIDTLITRTQSIIDQNARIIELAKNILEKEEEKPLVSEIIAPLQPVMEEEKESIIPKEQKIIPKEEPAEAKEEKPEEKETVISEPEPVVIPEPEPVVEPEPVPEPVKEEPKAEPVKEEPKKESSSVLDFLHARVMKDTPSKEERNKAAMETPEAKPVEKPVEKPAAAEHVPDAGGDLFASIAETAHKPKSIAEQFESRTSRNLMTSIGISEKFLFINDLFSGSMKEYTDFINELNAAASLDASMKIINAAQTKKKWARNAQAFVTLVTIIEKRFQQ